jgi:hypothetical protein
MTRLIVRMSGTGIPAHLFQNLRLILGYRGQISGNQVIITVKRVEFRGLVTSAKITLTLPSPARGEGFRIPLP